MQAGRGCSREVANSQTRQAHASGNSRSVLKSACLRYGAALPQAIGRTKLGMSAHLLFPEASLVWSSSKPSGRPNSHGISVPTAEMSPNAYPARFHPSGESATLGLELLEDITGWNIREMSGETGGHAWRREPVRLDIRDIRQFPQPNARCARSRRRNRCTTS